MKLNLAVAVTLVISSSLSSLSMAQTSPPPLALLTSQPWLENNTATGLAADYILGCYSSGGVECRNQAGDPHAAVSPARVVRPTGLTGSTAWRWRTTLGELRLAALLWPRDGAKAVAQRAARFGRRL
jgi:hypothetical protein